MSDVTPDFDTVLQHDGTTQVFARKVVTLTSGESITVDARGMAKVSVFAATGASVTWSRVLTDTDTTHGTGELAVTAPSATELVSQAVDWPFYRVSSLAGTVYVVVV